MNLYGTAQPGFDRPDEPCIYDLDSLCFWHEESRAAPAKSLPDHIANYVAPDEGQDRPPVPRDVPPIQEWFPMGVYEACRKHGARLWMMPQAWGTAESAPLDPPHYGYRGGMRTPEPGEIKLQGWVAVAEGATGILFYATVATAAGEHQLWDAGWTETANTRAAGELFERLSRVAPVLCRLERADDEADFVASSNPRVLAHLFVKRAPPADAARYVVLASLDGFERQQLVLTIQRGQQRVYDLIARQDVTDSLRGIALPPGEGGLLLVGTPADFDADCRLIDAALHAGR